MTRTAHALKDPAGRVSGANGTYCAVAVRLPVRLRAACEVVALYGTGKTAPLARRSDVDAITFLKEVRADAVADLVALAIRGTELTQIPKITQTFRVTALRFVQPLRCPVTDLHRYVAVALLILDLGYYARTRLDDGAAAQAALLVEDLHHPDLAA